MKKPSWNHGVLEFVDVKEEGPRAPIATMHETVEGAVRLHSPVMDRQLDMDEAEGKPSGADEIPIICLYKCDCGKYVTDTMITQGMCAGHMMRHAVSMTDEEAEDMATQMEAMSLDTELTENETVLLKVIRSKLAERWM